MKDVFEEIFHKTLAAKEAKGRNEGLTEGRREGLTEGRADIISRMLAKGMTPEQVSDLIALPLAEVLALRGGA